ncbi:MAG: response regulator [Deltaproteobacteria bacterium]|nr:response regulator [Deltaproteobacteria bacterium]
MAGARPAGVVLVVDDDPDIRDMIGQALELEGWRVVGAANGEEALRVAREGPRPDVILLDLMMPVMNGWEFLDDQRRDERLAAIPVVLISGDERLKEKAAKARVAGFLKKPMDLMELLDAVQRHGGAAWS